MTTFRRQTTAITLTTTAKSTGQAAGVNLADVQIERILKINELTVITDDVVAAARSTLVIGTA